MFLSTWSLLSGQEEGKRKVFVVVFESGEGGVEIDVEQDRFLDKEDLVYVKLATQAVKHCLSGIPVEVQRWMDEKRYPSSFLYASIYASAPPSLLTKEGMMSYFETFHPDKRFKHPLLFDVDTRSGLKRKTSLLSSSGPVSSFTFEFKGVS